MTNACYSCQHRKTYIDKRNKLINHICNEDGVERQIDDLQYGTLSDCKHWETDGGYQDIQDADLSETVIRDVANPVELEGVL